MDIHTDLRDFSGRCRLFPLPNVVLFPHVILPLHIFEPRYRQMTRDALMDDQLLTIVQIRPHSKDDPWIEPVAIMEVACVGRIVQHESLPDGRFNLLLLGCKRVRLEREIDSSKLYRMADATILEDEFVDSGMEGRRDELIELFLEVLKRNHRLDPDFTRLLRSDLPLGMLSDIIAHALDISGSIKQLLLEEPGVGRRIAAILSILRGIAGEPQSSRRFPPPFSLN